MRLWLMRLAGWAGVQCGAFGGSFEAYHFATDAPARWCRKPLGHNDSCAFEFCAQPHWKWRWMAKR